MFYYLHPMNRLIHRTGMAAPGIYLAELRLDGIRAGQVKLALQ